MEEAVMQQSPTQPSTSATNITITENVNVIEVVEHINVLSGAEDANIEVSLPEMMISKDENLSFSAENLGIPVNGAVSIQQEEIEKIKISSDSSVRTEVQNIGIIMENQAGVQELYLDGVYQKAETQEFYCPNCKSCIQKVLIQSRDWEEAKTPLCTSCFSLLIPIGSWLFPCLVPPDEPVGVASDGEPADSTPGPAKKVPPPVVQPPVVQPPESSKKWEILKSIVYGGLTESIASLSVVTSAASADATTLSIVALALANLIGGLFILVHNLWEMKSEEFTTTHSETNAAEVDRYYMTLGHADNFILHATIAIMSFLVFGLVPPIVYGFAFYDSSSKDLKLAAVAAASLVCITLLAIAKAYIQKPTEYVTYLRTVVYYVGSGALASVVSYIAGDLIKKLIAKLGWLGSSSNLALPLSEIRVRKSGWGSY